MRQESTGLLGAASAYDEVPYASYPYAQSHPDRLATIATLFGMSPPPIDKCRVLELGCASGGNLIPMAYGLRDSEFLGIDISAHHIAEGQALCKTLALTNIELRRFDILDLPTSLGSFDYIIAHGLYSWVPPAVQEKILKICRSHLVSQGVAYISYNTYPGWHFRGMIRDMMLYHTRQFSTPKERAAQGRALLDFLAKSVPTKDSAYGTMLQAELDLLGQLSDNYILHDHLEQANEPLYFHEFAERAGAAGLRYLGEADFNVMVTDALPQDIARTLQHISKDILRTEQYMDFVRNRTFRQTLLCHEEVVLRRALAPDVLKGLAVASSTRPVQEHAAIDSEESVSFRTHLNDIMSAKLPATKTAFQLLGELWPRSIGFDNLCEAVSERLGAQGGDYPKILGTDLLAAYSRNLVELHTREVDCITDPGPTPRASLLARQQATRSRQVTNLRHEMMELDDVNRQLLGLLDGYHTRADMVNGLHQAVRDGTLTVHEGENELTEPARLEEVLMRAVEQLLPRLARSAFLEA